MRHLVLIATMLIAFVCATPAQYYKMLYINSKSGLPHQQISSLAQDSEGYIWIGTRNGLSRYDGYTVKNYFNDNNDPHSLAHNFVDAIFVDSKKRLWVFTSAGVCRYRPSTDDFERYSTPSGIISSVVETNKGKIFCGGSQLYTYDEEKNKFVVYPIIESGYILSLAVDSKDNLFVATSTAIFHYNSDMSRLHYLNKKYYSDFVTGTDDIIHMYFDSQGMLWLSRNGKGVMRIDLNGDGTKTYSAADISDGTVRVITEDRKHRIWLGTEKGVTIINPDGRIQILRKTLDSSGILSDNAIYSIINDKNGNIWIGSYFGGVDVILNNDDGFKNSEPGYGPRNIKGKVPRMMVETKPGIYWIATEDGGINVYDSINDTFDVFDNIPHLGTNVHTLMFERESSTMWIGTFRNGLFVYDLKTKVWRHYDNEKGLSGNSIFSIVQQSNGRIWIASTLGLRYYDPATDTFRKTGDKLLNRTFVYTLDVDKHDNIWAGTAHDGLFMVNGRTGVVRQWAKQKDAQGLKDNYITTLYSDKGGTLWIGTNNNGLQYMDKRTGRIGSLCNNILSPSCTVCSIIADREGMLWISTSQGLFRFSPKHKTTARFSTENGLPTNQFNFSSAILTSGGELFFGTVDGLVSFNPANIRKQTKPFHVHLKSLFINNIEMNASTKDTPLTDTLDKMREITLSYDQARNFIIEYGVILPGNANTIEYRVFLEGMDKQWRDVGTERKFSGYNFPPGKYRLHIRANRSNKGWEKCPEKILDITVEPPIWLSVWAFIIYIAVLGFGVYATLRITATRIKEKNEVKIANMEKKKVEEMDREKSEFFTIVSHELKTPLSLIVAPLRSISHQDLTEDSVKHLNMALKSTKKMEELIDELVTFNKVETNNFPFYIQRGNPLIFIERLIVPYRDTANNKGIQLFCGCEDNGEDVWFSPSYVERIISNLLSNAFKFTPRGGKITVRACIATSDDGKDTNLHIEVADTGIGIAKEELGNIFNKYYQTRRGYNMNNNGWGIGLALIKRLSEVHKGHVSVESEPGKGAKFVVDLNVDCKNFDPSSLINDDKVIIPLEHYKFQTADLCTDNDNNTARQTVTADDKMSILIVEDNYELLAFINDYFSKNYNIYTATDGKEALDIAKSEPVSLVISDVMMPVMDGIELCRRLKGDVATSHIPVILLTAKSDSSDMVAGYESGADAYVTKPFDPQVLELQIKNIMSLHKVRQNEIAESENGDIETSSLSVIDKEFIRKMNRIVDERLSDSDFAVTDITSELAVSRSLLHTKMKNLVGMSMGDYIRKKRLDMAVRLLREGYNVSETAYRTGFSDPNYFSKTFKKHLGVSPSEYSRKPATADESTHAARTDIHSAEQQTDKTNNP